MYDYFSKINKVGIVGYGSVGKRYSYILKKLGISVHIFSVGKSLLLDKDARDNFKIFRNEEDFWQSGIKAILICNPSYMHLEWIKKSINRKIPTFCEKPVCVSPNELFILRKILQENQFVPNCSGYMWRYEHGVNILKKLINRINLSNIIKVSLNMVTHLPDWHPWENYKDSYASNKKMGGGLVLTCSHEIDTLRYLFGELNLISATTKSVKILLTDTEDFVTALFKNENGIPIQLDMNWYQKKNIRLIKIKTDKSEIIWNQNQKFLSISDNNTDKINKLNYSKNIDSAYEKMIKDFLKSILENNKPRSTLTDATRTLVPCFDILGFQNE